MKPIRITAATAADASRIYSAQRDFSGKGASTFPDGLWKGKHISYNGRVWDSVDDWQNKIPPFYCPGTGYRDQAQAAGGAEIDRLSIAAKAAAKAAREGRQ